MENKKNNMISRSIYEDIREQLDVQFDKETSVLDEKEIAGWFMGTEGENLSKVSEIILSVLNGIVGDRALVFPKDPNYITPEVKISEEYKNGIKSVEKETNNLIEILKKYSLPTQSLRYQGHMLWDITLPSMIGYFAGMLQNQNNVTPQASPATTVLELLASNDIAEMAGFEVKKIYGTTSEVSDEATAWGHISCDGSVANIESLWAARELKYLPVGIQYALNNDKSFENIKEKLYFPDEEGKPIVETSIWKLLNMKQDDILALPQQICNELIPDETDKETKENKLAEVWATLTSSYSINAKGMHLFHTDFKEEGISAPCLLVPSTKHYSWPKGTSMLGMGNGKKGIKNFDFKTIKDEGLINIYVDENGRMDTNLLKKVLKTCKDNKKPVIMVVGVMGTTEEGAVDPMKEILNIRKSFRNDSLEEPFEYSIHADAAWGGYFLTCCRKEFAMEGYPTINNEQSGFTQDEKFDNDNSWFRESVYNDMKSICKCDSVTIDPHKMGYIPYPAGNLTYRNDKIVNLLTFSAPYISSGIPSDGINTRNIGECGIEGSKSGAAAASVYLSHRVIRPDKRGYGKIINQSMLNSKIFYLYLKFIKDVFTQKEVGEFKFDLVMFDEFPESFDESKKADIVKCLKESSFEFLKSTNILKEVAGDQNVIDYIFIDKTDRLEKRTIELNNAIFNKLSLNPGSPVESDDIFVSMTTFGIDEYGDNFMQSLGKRLYGETAQIPTKIPCIRSVIMDPWAIYTAKEQSYNFFKDLFIPQLITVVNKLCIKED